MIFDYIDIIDRIIVQTINSCNNPFLDELMWIVSVKYTWIPFYILLIFFYYKKTNLKKSLLFLFFVLISVGFADQISVNFFKEFFQRLRPSHNTLLKEQLHLHVFANGDLYRGGSYGFVSSHAANFFAVLTFAYLVMKKYYSNLFIPFLILGSIVGYSRIYLGVHYLTDVIAGAILGVFIAVLFYRFLFIFIVNKIK